MKVAVVVNSDQRCGLAEFGRGVASAIAKKYPVDTMPTVPTSGYDAVLINYQAGALEFPMEPVRALRSNGGKVGLIFNEALHKIPIKPGDSLYEMDAIVAHDHAEIVGTQKLFRRIEIGVDDVDEMPEYKLEDGLVIGTAGFPFPSKRMDVPVKAVQRLGGKAVVVAPPHRYFGPELMFQEWRGLLGDRLTLITDFLPQTEVVKILARNTMNVYFAQEDYAGGQSGSVRMILAAGRPTIARRCPRSSGLHQYDDEIYFVESESDVYSMAEKIWNDIQAGRPVQKPNRVREDLWWSKVGPEYIKLVEDMVNR